MLNWYRQILLVLLILSTHSGYAQNTAQFSQTGGCSYYGDEFHGRRTNSGERFDNKKFTCAHRKLPFGTILKVTNLQKNKVTFVRVNDRGPFVKTRILDVSKAAAKELDLIKYGVCKVKIVVVGNGDSINYGLVHLFEIPEDWSEEKIMPKKYYNLSGDELMMSKAYGLQVVEFDNFADTQTFARFCIDNGLERVFYRMTEEVTGRKYTFYYGAELYDKPAIEKLKNELLKRGIETKVVRFP